MLIISIFESEWSDAHKCWWKTSKHDRFQMHQNVWFTSRTNNLCEFKVLCCVRFGCIGWVQSRGVRERLSREQLDGTDGSNSRSKGLEDTVRTWSRHSHDTVTTQSRHSHYTPPNSRCQDLPVTHWVNHLEPPWEPYRRHAVRELLLLLLLLLLLITIITTIITVIILHNT